MARRIKIKIPSKLLAFLAFFIFGYTIYLTTKTLARYQRLNQEIKKTEEEIAQLQEQNRQLKNLIIYFQSVSFKEKELRERLGYIKPGEKVIYFKEEANNEAISVEEKKETKKPNWQLWLEYLKINKS